MRTPCRSVRTATATVCLFVAALFAGGFQSPVLAQSATHYSLDQARNGTALTPTSPVDFQNGNAGASNSHFIEGHSIPYRLILSGISTGTHVVDIEWDIRNSGKDAIDYITQYDRLQPHGGISPVHAAELINPLAGLSGTFGAPATFALTAPDTVGSTVAGQPAASFNALAAAKRVLTIWNGSITGATYLSQGSLTAANSSTRLRITLTANASTVVLAWGGHIASGLDWGVGNSAAAISGSPYHTRLIAVDGSAGNQDRSLQASAVMAPPACDISGPSSLCLGSTQTFSAPSGAIGTTYLWSISGSGSIVGSTTGSSVQVLGDSPGGFTLSLTATRASISSTCTASGLVASAVPCSIDGPATLCPNATGTYSAPAGLASYAWTVTGSASIVGAANGSSIQVLASGSCGGEFAVHLATTTEGGCAGSCDSKIPVVDTKPPVLSCPPNATVECGQSSEPAATGAAAATDACGSNITITFGDALRLVKGAGTVTAICQARPTIERTWTATDPCGNSSQCVQLIETVDTTPPVIACPPNAVVECGQPNDPSATGTATATDVCGGTDITITFGDALRLVKGAGTVTASCQARPTIERTWTATDPCGNSSQCVQLIEAVDTTPPVLTCPPDVTVECGSPSDPSATGTATATDACDANITITFGDALRLMKNTAGVAMTGCTVGAPIERTWTATDACGNVSTCVQHIQTVDVTPPALTCPPNTVVECGQPFDPTATGTATATDACGSDITITFGDAQRLVKNAGPVTAGCVARPPIDRTWTATDACGNSSTCVQTIEFKDTTAPVVTCPADVTIECSQSTDPSSTGTPTSHDVCDANITITFGDALRLVKGAGAVTQDCTTSGSDIIRTWTFTDACGNTSQCVQTIHIADNTACPRSPGFWRAQCDQAPTGQTKFDAAHMEAISARADQQAATFSWPSGGAFSGLCSALSTGGNMTTRRQAKRQFAAFLANIAVGQLGYVGNNGDVVSLGLSTPVSCSGLSSTTVGALLSEIDARLVALESQSLQNSTVKNEYSHISACLDPINNGKAFTNVCSASLVENALYPADNLLGVDDAAAGSMRRPTPNPFSSTTRLSYAIPASGLPLHVGVYDISGRLVTTLADGESKAGSLELAWNGRDTSGNPVNGGVYFIRARVGSVEQSMRVVFLKP